jgi:hypothetical protein
MRAIIDPAGFLNILPDPPRTETETDAWLEKTVFVGASDRSVVDETLRSWRKLCDVARYGLPSVYRAIGAGVNQQCLGGAHIFCEVFASLKSPTV